VTISFILMITAVNFVFIYTRALSEIHMRWKKQRRPSAETELFVKSEHSRIVREKSKRKESKGKRRRKLSEIGSFGQKKWTKTSKKLMIQ